jgi:hypothetical protein
MAADAGDERVAALAGTICAAVMIAQQVAGKSTRDALFLSHFPVESLPLMMVASAVLSVATMAAMIRMLATFGPGRVVPGAFAMSAGFLVLIALANETSGKLAAVLLFLHIGTVGAIIISGFWSVVNERFDPRSARRTVGRIAVGGTLGGLVGGLIAMAAAESVSFGQVVIGLAVLHMLCVPLVRLLRRKNDATDEAIARLRPASGTMADGFRYVRGDSYLRTLALLVLTVTATEALIDFVFKAEAAARYGDGPSLLRFFAIFYTAAGALTFLFQVLLGRRLLERFGLLPSLVTLPISVAAATTAAIALPGLLAAALVRGTESVLRSSLYRSGYELLYVPVAQEAKRTAKTLIDVGADRAGNVIGGLVVTGILASGIAGETRIMQVLACLLALCTIGLVVRLRSGYTGVLEESMVNRALALELSGLSDESEFRSTILLSLGGLDVRQALGVDVIQPRRLVPVSVARSETGQVPAVGSSGDPFVDTLVALRSKDADRILAALREAQPLPRDLVPHIIPLLAWDPVAVGAIAALQPFADDAAGQLGDVLLSEETDFTVRRRVPRVLGAAMSQRALDLLVAGLHDRRFEVRFQCGQALRRIVRSPAEVSVSRDAVMEAVAREADVDRGVWENHRLLDETTTPSGLDSGDEGSPFMIELVRVKSPEEPLRTAYRALHTDDTGLRGTALEYLESVLPARIHRQVLPFLEDRPRSPAPSRPREEVLRALLQSNRSIQLSLESLKGHLGE